MTGTTNDNLNFLRDGGEMGNRLRNSDWSKSSVGPPSTWPLSLRNAVSNMLRTDFPMLVLWGKEFSCFYNDAYLPSFTEGQPAVGSKAQDIWQEGWDFIGKHLNSVLTTGKAVTFEHQPVTLVRNGAIKNVYWTFCYSLILDDHGEAGGVMVTCMDTTRVIEAEAKIIEREQNLKNIVSQAPFPVCILRGPDFIIETVNVHMLDFWKKSFEQVINKPLFTAVPESTIQGYGQWLNKVMQTGEPHAATELPVTLMRDGESQLAYINFSYQPLRDINGKVTGVLATAADVTEQVSARQKRIYETVIGATPDLVYVFDLDYRFSYANNALLTMWGKSWDNAVGKGLRDNGYEEWHAAMHEREIDQVVATKASIRGVVSFPHAVLGTRVYDYIFVPVLNSEGQVEAVAGTTRDISDINQIESQLRESEQRFRSLILQAPVAIAVFHGDDFIADIANDAYLQMVDKTASEFLNVPLFESLPLVRPIVEPLLQSVMQTGEPFAGNEIAVVLHRNGQIQTGYFNFTYSPLYGNSEKPNGFMVVANEVTAQVIARRKIEDSERLFREKEATLANAIALAELGTWQLDGRTGHVLLSPRYAQMVGMKESQPDLDSVISVVIPRDRQRVRHKFTEAMRPGSDGRFDAEYRVIHAGTGNTHIIHALGQAFFDIQGNFAQLEGTAQDVTAQREIQLALENQVQVRTEELQATNEELAATNEELSESTQMLMQSNEELSQFAYVASHDLQEPVRKISVFVEMLEKTLPNISAQSYKYLRKIDDSANRMLSLIRDVLAHSQISKSTQGFEPVDLALVLQNSLTEFELLIQERGCTVEYDVLPVIDAIEVQMNQLFNNLISNALKFSKPGKPLVLSIRVEKLSESQKGHYPALLSKRDYYRILFIDNGIGFEPIHALQIFDIFQRLHTKTEYSGTGIGLATCKKVVQNHGGQISATSDIGKGATFEVILPSSQII